MDSPSTCCRSSMINVSRRISGPTSRNCDHLHVGRLAVFSARAVSGFGMIVVLLVLATFAVRADEPTDDIDDAIIIPGDTFYFGGTIGKRLPIQLSLCIVSESLAGKPFSPGQGQPIRGSYYYEYDGRCFVLRDGHPKEIRLEDLSRSRAEFIRRICELCETDLRRQGAGWLAMSPELKLCRDDIGGIQIRPGGLTVVFNPYAVGCFAEGGYFVEIPWRKVVDRLRENPEVHKSAEEHAHKDSTLRPNHNTRG